MIPWTCLQWQTIILRRVFNKRWYSLYTPLKYSDACNWNVQSEEIILDIFTERINNHYILRNINHLETPVVRTVCNRTGIVYYLGPKIREIVPEKCKTLYSLNSFKESIEDCVSLNCPCRLCKTYEHGVGFLEG